MRLSLDQVLLVIRQNVRALTTKAGLQAVLRTLATETLTPLETAELAPAASGYAGLSPRAALLVALAVLAGGAGLDPIKTVPVKGDNLLNLRAAGVVVDAYINPNYIGLETALPGWTASAKIAVTAGERYYCNHDITNAAWYASDGTTFVANWASSGGVAPAGAAFLRLSVQSVIWGETMLIWGQAPPDVYQPYWEELVKPVTADKRPFAGKKIGLLGDSLTFQGFYIPALLAATGAAAYEKQGFPGEVFRTGTNLLPLGAFADCDVIQVAFGTNEYGHGGNDLGTTSDPATANTVCGAVRYCYQQLRSQYSRTPLYFVTPTERGAYLAEPVSPAPNPYSLTIKNVGQAIKATCGVLGVPVVDLYEASNINALTFGHTLQPDQLHWSEFGAAHVGQVIGETVNQLFTA